MFRVVATAFAPSLKLPSPRRPQCDLPELVWEVTRRPTAVTVPLGGLATLLPSWIFSPPLGLMGPC